MNTAISKTFEVDEPIEKVWKYLTDPTKIVVCVPGASLTEQIDDKNFKGEVSLKFGPVKASYSGEIAFEDMDVENHKMTLKGKGLDSKGKGSADLLMKVDLNEREGGGTIVESSMQIGIVGKLAQFGSRLINDVTDQLFDQFVANFKAKLAEDSPPVEVAETSVEEDAKVADEPAKQATNVNVTETQNTTVSEPKKVSKVTSPPPPSTPKTKVDNSVNVMALGWAVIKGFFARLFGSKK